MGDQPDYTKLFVLNVELPESVRFMPTKAEMLDKKVATYTGVGPGPFCTIIPTPGKKIILLKIFIMSQSASPFPAWLKTLQSGVGTKVFDFGFVDTAPTDIDFPCWKPDQDNYVDATTPTVWLECQGCPNISGFILYGEE